MSGTVSRLNTGYSSGFEPSAEDLSAYWLPFTPNRAFKAAPRMLVSAKGRYYTTADGRQVLDAIAGIWCSNLGHSHPRIVAAIQEQVAVLDYAASFHFAHPAALQLATEIAALFPEPLNHVFFTNSGSEAVDTTMKIALAYHQLRGEGSRTRFIGRQYGYHGAGFGGISVGGLPNNRRQFGPLLPGVDHLSFPYEPAEQSFTRGQAQVDLAPYREELERTINLHHPSTVAAVVVEPFAGSGGVYIPPAGYLEMLREVTARYGILLIVDEVISGFGRLGAANACTLFGVAPDLVATAKGINNATVPLGGVVASSTIYDTFLERTDSGIELFHGYTYSGHPLATTAGLAAQAAYREEDAFAAAARLAPYLEERAHSLRGEPHVSDIRNLGLVAGLTIAPRDQQPGSRATDVFQYAFENGVVIRHNGDTLAFSPILSTTESEIDTMIEVTRDALRAIA
ncbi:MAG: aminotransferase class III-fold pyridoxal phosphate-dependent enzyme [Pseudomonadota bacterium]